MRGFAYSLVDMVQCFFAFLATIIVGLLSEKSFGFGTFHDSSVDTIHVCLRCCFCLFVVCSLFVRCLPVVCPLFDRRLLTLSVSSCSSPRFLVSFFIVLRYSVYDANRPINEWDADMRATNTKALGSALLTVNMFAMSGSFVLYVLLLFSYPGDAKWMKDQESKKYEEDGGDGGGPGDVSISLLSEESTTKVDL
jgi:hypothetical protein